MNTEPLSYRYNWFRLPAVKSRPFDRRRSTPTDGRRTCSRASSRTGTGTGAESDSDSDESDDEEDLKA